MNKGLINYGTVKMMQALGWYQEASFSTITSISCGYMYYVTEPFEDFDEGVVTLKYVKGHTIYAPTVDDVISFLRHRFNIEFVTDVEICHNEKNYVGMVKYIIESGEKKYITTDILAKRPERYDCEKRLVSELIKEVYESRSYSEHIIYKTVGKDSYVDYINSLKERGLAFDALQAK